MAMLAGHWHLRGFGMWAVEETRQRRVRRASRVHYPEGWPDREVAWALARPYWRLGYALEAACAALDEAFGRLGWPRVISLMDPANTRSARLAVRLGERREGEAIVRGHRVAVYALSRADWLAGCLGLSQSRPAVRAARMHDRGRYPAMPHETS